MKNIYKTIGLALLLGSGLSDYAASQAIAPTVDDVLAEIADYVGADPADLDADQDLVEDLFLDRAEAFQVFAVLCDRYERPVPEGDGVTLIGDIARYLAETPPRVVPRGTVEVTDDDEQAQRVVTVYYATDRERTSSDDPIDFYSGNRSPNGRIYYGTTEVMIPRNHVIGRLETPFLGLQFLNSPNRHITLTRVTPLSSENFWSGIGDALNLVDRGDGRTDIVVFVHGYRVPFEGAARRTAQIVVDMANSDIGFRFVPVFYSWPSDGTLLGYLSDREDVAWSAAHIEDFLLDVAEHSSDARIHLVAHSLGAQGLLTALRTLARNSRSGSGALFENVILAAPDFDTEVFEQQLARNEILRLSRRWTVYASDQDSALKASVGINSVRRLGLPIIAVRGVDMIDATGLEVTPWNVPEFHSYFATKKQVIRDVASVFSGVSPSTRRLLRARLGDLSYWRLGITDSDR